MSLIKTKDNFQSSYCVVVIYQSQLLIAYYFKSRMLYLEQIYLISLQYFSRYLFVGLPVCVCLFCVVLCVTVGESDQSLEISRLWSRGS